jgi:ArsR family transcriptional regulator, arsenate/arsenite/antimonite-responsive transcriptional repressor / arsenate reductase (thioredoxin)
MSISSTSLTNAPPAPDVLSFFKALADETRLTILRLLALTDLRAGELVEHLHCPHNAVSYHLKHLRALGLLRDRRSTADARDIYYSLDLDRLRALYTAAGDALRAWPEHEHDTQETAPVADASRPLRVLFLCTHNSARSQLAEGILRYLAGGAVEVASAGSEPTAVHPYALALLREWGIDTTHHSAKSLDLFAGQSFDYIITVCDRIREHCPVFPNDPVRIHWSLPDPALITDEAEQRQAFRTVQRELITRIRYLLNLPHPATGRRIAVRSLVPLEGAS